MAPISGLQQLDDHVVLFIMKWLDRMPDIFNLSQCCTRFKRLAHDSRSWLIVQSAPGPQGWSANTYRTLADAVHASRPGDTIRLCPGTHSCSGIVVNHCLSICGPGLSPEAHKGAVLVGQTAAQPTLDIRAACKLTGLTITSQVAPCVLHRSGALTLEGCHLTCDSRGLDHLCAPLVTCAVNTSHDVKDGIDGQGGLTVTECLLEGGSRAVSCEGTGQLQAVRVIYQAHKALFYLHVDCQVPGVLSSMGGLWRRADAMAKRKQVAGEQGVASEEAVCASRTQDTCRGGDAVVVEDGRFGAAASSQSHVPWTLGRSTGNPMAQLSRVLGQTRVWEEFQQLMDAQCPHVRPKLP